MSPFMKRIFRDHIRYRQPVVLPTPLLGDGLEQGHYTPPFLSIRRSGVAQQSEPQQTMKFKEVTK